MVDGKPADGLSGAGSEAADGIRTASAELSPEQITKVLWLIETNPMGFDPQELRKMQLDYLNAQLVGKVVRFHDPDGVLKARYPAREEGEFALDGRDLHISGVMPSEPGKISFSTPFGEMHKYSFLEPDIFASHPWQFVETAPVVDTASEKEDGSA